METAGPHKRDPARRPPRAPVAVSMTPGAGEPGVAQRPARPACGTRRHDGSGSKGAMDFQKRSPGGRSIIKKSVYPLRAPRAAAHGPPDRGLTRGRNRLTLWVAGRCQWVPVCMLRCGAHKSECAGTWRDGGRTPRGVRGGVEYSGRGAPCAGHVAAPPKRQRGHVLFPFRSFSAGQWVGRRRPPGQRASCSRQGRVKRTGGDRPGDSALAAQVKRTGDAPRSPPKAVAYSPPLFWHKV